MSLKISALTDGVTAEATDRIPIVRDPTGTPVNRYITPSYLQTFLNLDPIDISIALGFYLTSMTTGNTATANGAALTADVIAAQGVPIIIPGLNYNFGGGSIGTAAVDITSSEATGVTLWFLSGAKLTCNTSGKNSTNVFFWFREGVRAEIIGGEFDGGTIAEICVRSLDVTATPGCEITVRDARIHNFGWTTADSATAANAGTIGILVSNGARLVVDNCQFYDCRSREDATTGNQPGKTCFIQWLNASSGQQNPFKYSITNCEFDSTVDTNESNDLDHIHILQQAQGANAQGLIDNCRFKFNGKNRRVLKYQGGGVHKVSNCHISPNQYWVASSTGATSITITAATAATPGAFTATAHGVPQGTPVKLAGMSGGTWNTINGIEYIMVPVTDANTFNLFGPGAAIDTTGLGTYSFSALNPGNVRRTNGQGQALAISAAVAATGEFTTQYGAVTTAHGFVVGDMVRLENLAGGTWSTLNNIDYYIASVPSTSKFTLRAASLLDTSGLNTYDTGAPGNMTRVNGCSLKGHNGIDWAGGNDGLLEIENCWMDLSGFRNGVVQSIGVGGTIHCRNSVIIGNRYDANRLIPETGAGEVGTPAAWLTGALDSESTLVNCDIYGFAIGASPQGTNNKVMGCRFIDPRLYWFLSGGSVSRDGLRLTDNEVITRTPYSLNATTNPSNADFARCGSIRNWTNVDISRNRLIQRGNTFHGTRFMAFIINGATGQALDNAAPAGCLPISYTTGVSPINVQTGTAVAGAVTLHSLSGKITSESLTTAAGATYTLTITNNFVVATDLILPNLANGTNSAGTPAIIRCTAGAGTITIIVYNHHALNALNGTLVIGYKVEKA